MAFGSGVVVVRACGMRGLFVEGSQPQRTGNGEHTVFRPLTRPFFPDGQLFFYARLTCHKEDLRDILHALYETEQVLPSIST